MLPFPLLDGFLSVIPLWDAALDYARGAMFAAGFPEQCALISACVGCVHSVDGFATLRYTRLLATKDVDPPLAYESTCTSISYRQ